MMHIDKSTQITEGIRQSFRSTDCKMENRICYGYTTAADGELVINDTEAKIVRWLLASISSRFLTEEDIAQLGKPIRIWFS